VRCDSEKQSGENCAGQNTNDKKHHGSVFLVRSGSRFGLVSGCPPGGTHLHKPPHRAHKLKTLSTSFNSVNVPSDKQSHAPCATTKESLICAGAFIFEAMPARLAGESETRGN